MIILFYPTLPIHTPPDANHLERVIQPFSTFKDWAFNAIIQCHSAPKEPKKKKPKPQRSTRNCAFDNEPCLKFRSIPNEIPTPKELDAILHDEDNDEDLKNWESSRQKQDLASVYNLNVKWHLKKHFTDRKNGERRFRKKGEEDLFIHLFAFPLYSMVSAYWARLVISTQF